MRWCGIAVLACSMGCQTGWSEERLLRHMADEECAYLRACNEAGESWIESRSECRADRLAFLQESLDEARETSGCVLIFDDSFADACASSISEHWDVGCDEVPDDSAFAEGCEGIWVIEC